MTDLSSAKLLLHNPEGNVLLLMRSETDEHRPGTYDLPGGGIAPDEDPLTAVVREAEEEIGLSDEDYELACYFDRSYTSRNLGRISAKRFFVGRTLGFAAVTLSEEHTGYDWFPPEIAAAKAGHPVQQEAIAYIHFPGIVIPLERALQSLSTTH